MTRATILLMPLFGVQFLLTLVRPNMKDCTLEQVYYYIFYTMDGLQGTFVAFFYCYLNKEVRILHTTYRALVSTVCPGIIKFVGKSLNYSSGMFVGRFE
jgi:hypothetical protein